ncbi:hypothetical protein NX059_002002 [Plenodomus lindquistii]|nr:hypothetical protein NX059_002002 [Plenodomus lindquistii]
MSAADQHERVLEQVDLWNQAHRRDNPELCDYLRLKFAEKLFELYALLRDSYPPPSVNPVKVSVGVVCMLVAGAGILGAATARWFKKP